MWFNLKFSIQQKWQRPFWGKGGWPGIDSLSHWLEEVVSIGIPSLN